MKCHPINGGETKFRRETIERRMVRGENMCTVVTLDFEKKEDFARWQGFVSSRSDTQCTDRAEWRLLFKELYGISSYSYACEEQGGIRGVISLYHIRSPFLGNMLVTCPFFGYGGFYADGDRARDALLERTEALARELKVDFIELRLAEKLPPPYAVNTDFLEFDLHLSETPEAAWTDRLSSNARQNIRKSQKRPLEFSVSSDHRPCYALLSRALRDLGTPFHGERFFTLLKKYFGSDVCFSEVRHEGNLVAGGIIVRFRSHVITPYIGSLNRYRNLGSNYCQYWGIVNHCCERQVDRFSLGRSPKDSSHVQFKRKWGPEEIQVYYNYRILNPAGRYRTVSRPAKIFRLAVAVWKRLPVQLTRLVGPWVFRYIP
jgi:FemAB-related protein (PEP-CTERM system-associated)